MEARALTSQLSEDFSWLEEHSRKQELATVSVGGSMVERAMQASELRMAAALVRNCLGPALDNQPATPLHVAVVGGAGTGKSLVANMLSGAPAAESNPQAGFTRHPIVFTHTPGALNWTGHLGFLGPLKRAEQDSPSSVDADLYQVRRVPADSDSAEILNNFVIWDCPDMTTWAAGGQGKVEGGYVTRLLEVSGLADVLVYVASDERYNDEVPTQFLNLLLRTGKPVIVCLTKMAKENTEALVTHFQQDVAAKLPKGIQATLPIPFLTPEQLADLQGKTGEYRIPLLNQISVLGHNPEQARKRSLNGALHFLVQQQERLLSVAKQDVDALNQWQRMVQNGQVELDQRYRLEYLQSEKYRGFDEALARLIQLLELPGAGKVVSSALWVLRTPGRLLKAAFGKAFKRPDLPPLPELPILQDAVNGWIDMLRKESSRLSSTHPLWVHISQGFAQQGLNEQIQERFQQGYRAFHLALSNETDKTARAIYEKLEQSPGALNTLRGGKLSIELAAIGGVVFIDGGLGLSDFLLAPIAASLTQQLVEVFGKQYVDKQRELARQKQQALMAQYITAPLSEWLANWPATGGSPFERLQLALRRIPTGIEQMQTLIKSTMA